MPYSLVRRSLLVTAGLLLVVQAAEAGDAGRWNLPSNCAQYFGYGYGPGHQAPMIRAPTYQPPEVPRIVVIPARDCPFCQTGCSPCASVPPANAWDCDALVMPGAPPQRGRCFLGGCQSRGSIAPTPAPAVKRLAPAAKTPLFAAPPTANAAEPPVASQEQESAEVKRGNEAG